MPTHQDRHSQSDIRTFGRILTPIVDIANEYCQEVTAKMGEACELPHHCHYGCL